MTKQRNPFTEAYDALMKRKPSIEEGIRLRIMEMTGTDVTRPTQGQVPEDNFEFDQEVLRELVNINSEAIKEARRKEDVKALAAVVKVVKTAQLAGVVEQDIPGCWLTPYVARHLKKAGYNYSLKAGTCLISWEHLVQD